MFVFLLIISLTVSLVVCNPLYSNYTSIFIDGEEHDLVGDMVFRKDQNPYRSNSPNSYNADTTKKWPNGVIPYNIDLNSGYTQEERDVIRGAMDEITSRTGGCITFVPLSNQRSYITIRDTGTGCNSNVGQSHKSRDQQVSLDRPYCVQNGIVVHELIHAIGFDHEHNRPDRDYYVWIDYSNIDPKFHYAFKKATWSKLFFQYDFDSIMHYEQHAFSTDGKPTIYSRVDYIDMKNVGHKYHMNDMDVRKIKALYGCN